MGLWVDFARASVASTVVRVMHFRVREGMNPLDIDDPSFLDVVSFENAPVLFYGHRNGLYCVFSNFYPSSFVFDGHTFACSEQAFMLGKSDDPVYRARVLETTNPYEVKKLGRTAKLRPNWDSAKYGWMLVVLKAKFSQNPALRDLLLSTGNRPIHENCDDPWWGGGPNFPRGRDLLGKALMEVRAWFQQSRCATCGQRRFNHDEILGGGGGAGFDGTEFGAHDFKWDFPFTTSKDT